jgi:hypothetical protein
VILIYAEVREDRCSEGTDSLGPVVNIVVELWKRWKKRRRKKGRELL